MCIELYFVLKVRIQVFVLFFALRFVVGVQGSVGCRVCVVRDFSEDFGAISRSETENTSRVTRVLLNDYHL